MSFVILIPARMKSTRLPNKPMADIEGLPMIVRVAERGRAAGADRVVVATDHEDIERVCREHGVEVVMTSASHPTGTDRLAEAVSKLGLADDEIVVNLQGDEPLMPVDVMQRVAALLAEHPDWAMTTAAHTMKDVEDFLNPNVVKVTCDVNGKALTFSRAPIPWPRDHFRETKAYLPEGFEALHHLGLYAYRVAFLKAFPTLKQAPIEKFESLEQLRALYYGYEIGVLTLDAALPAGVDTEADLERVRAIYRAKGADAA